MATLAERRTAAPAPAAAETRDRLRRRISLVVAFVVLVWSIAELVNLAAVHTIGPELYGVLVAALAVAAGAADVALLRSSERRFWVSAGVLALWAVIALGGVAGVVAHIVGPVAGHGPVDTRPRPIAAPLVFTLLGVAGGAALFFGQRLGGLRPAWLRPGGARVPEPGKE